MEGFCLNEDYMAPRGEDKKYLPGIFAAESAPSAPEHLKAQHDSSVATHSCRGSQTFSRQANDAAPQNNLVVTKLEMVKEQL